MYLSPEDVTALATQVLEELTGALARAYRTAHALDLGHQVNLRAGWTDQIATLQTLNALSAQLCAAVWFTTADDLPGFWAQIDQDVLLYFGTDEPPQRLSWEEALACVARHQAYFEAAHYRAYTYYGIRSQPEPRTPEPRPTDWLPGLRATGGYLEGYHVGNALVTYELPFPRLELYLAYLNLQLRYLADIEAELEARIEAEVEDFLGAPYPY